MREYHFCNSSGSSVTGAPHPRVLRVGVLVWNSDVQLLPAVAVARDSASKKLVRQGTARGSPKFVSVSTSGPLVPQGSLQNRPYGVTSKAAMGKFPELRCCTLPFAFWASLICEISRWRPVSSSKVEKISLR